MLMYLSDHETAVDLLYYDSIAQAVADLITRNRDYPISIGIHGDWGAGKSSILEMTEAAFTKDKNTACVRFNGWAFQGFEDAKIVIIESVVDEILRNRTKTKKLKESVSNLLKRVAWLKVLKTTGNVALTATTGVPAPGLVGDALSKEGYIKPDSKKATISHHMHQFREEFERVLEDADIDRLVVLIDDLDRCLPNTIIDTLEAIRLFLFIPKTAFVIAADEVMVEYAVRRHFPDLPSAANPSIYARNYLEKLVQVPFRIPTLGPSETRTYVTLLLIQSEVGEKNPVFQEVLDVAQEHLKKPWTNRGLERTSLTKAFEGGVLPTEIEEPIRLAEQITGVLAQGTGGNPRQLKRFLNSMSLRLSIAEARGIGAEIDRSTLAKVMLAERFSPDFYRTFSSETSSHPKGQSKLIQALETGNEDKADDAELYHKWTEDEWVIEWKKIQPSLDKVDLRPYTFIARDKQTPQSLGIRTTDIADMFDTLCGNSKYKMKAIETKISDLSPQDAIELFESLKEEILSSKLSKKPSGVEGIAFLVELQSSLENRFVTFIDNLPTKGIGLWVVAGWDRALTTPEGKKSFKETLEKWSQQEENKVLQKAAQLALGLNE